jgi:hypothetical protein
MATATNRAMATAARAMAMATKRAKAARAMVKATKRAMATAVRAMATVGGSQKGQNLTAARPVKEVVGGSQKGQNLTAARLANEVDLGARAPIKIVDGRPWSPGVYRNLRLLGHALEAAWERTFIAHF